jgi:hypothetical protein
MLSHNAKNAVNRSVFVVRSCSVNSSKIVVCETLKISESESAECKGRFREEGQNLIITKINWRLTKLGFLIRNLAFLPSVQTPTLDALQTGE